VEVEEAHAIRSRRESAHVEARADSVMNKLSLLPSTSVDDSR